MIAMTLLMLMMTMLYAGLWLAIKAWESGVGRVEDSNRVYLIQHWLRRHISQARPVTVPTESQQEQVAFAGEPQRLRFVTPLPAHRGGGGLSVVTIEVAKKGDDVTQQLMLRYQVLHPEIGNFFSTDGGSHTVLLDSIDGITFSYFGSDTADEEPRWRSSWQGQNHLPYLVRIAVRRPKDEPSEWPTLTIAPLSDGQTRPWLNRG